MSDKVVDDDVATVEPPPSEVTDYSGPIPDDK